METIIIKPRNKEEFDLVYTLMKRLKIPATPRDEKVATKKLSKKEFLDSFEDRLNQVQLDVEGKINLKDARDLLNEL